MNEVHARMRKMIEQRRRNEDAALVQYWKPSSAAQPGGLLAAEQMQIWIDWLVKDGQLKPGQLKPGSLFTNSSNPYAH